ncbi:ribonuclease E/G [Altererythrobacter sp. GH1-8]|uniref:ribonuclease E/G n=1 Tax=Altererythrobacter sp. GH1-8 TaxID=3349333 RepID=UPI00374DC7F0
MTWLVERGIGEDRALLMDGEHVLGAKLRWPGEMFAGQHIEAQLTSKPSGARRGVATLPNGQDILVDHLPPDLTEGQRVSLTITRAPIAERGRLKKAQGRYTSTRLADAPEWLAGARETREFAEGAWEDIWHTASSGEIQFEGGSLLFSVTPAMTLIDVDGDGSPRDVALAAAPVIARWLNLFDLGGNIGIDFPTVEAKADRKAVDAALDQALADWPHERTAMNGFGFVQIVARLEGPSLLHRFATSRTGMCARMALRQAELAQGTGNMLLLSIHPALKAKLKPEWLEDLSRRTGRQIEIETDPSLALEGVSAQMISR